MIQDRYKITVGEAVLDLSSPVVMTILNVTPDSFYAGSRLPDKDAITRAVVMAVEQGAGILDIGGYSSRPGAADVPPQEEYERLACAMEIVRRTAPKVPVSLDTFRAGVARRIIEGFGPCIVNDISAGRLDADMIPTVAGLQVPFIAMHMRSDPANMQLHTEYRDVVAEVTEYLEETAGILRNNGIGQFILDPGFGFAKTIEQNYQLLHGLDSICRIGYPVLSGVSRKSMIYRLLGSTPQESLTGTSVLNWESLVKGASVLRVHDTREAVEVVKLYNFYKQAQCRNR